MGYRLHVVDNLPPPFQMVHEQIVLMPGGAFAPVFNTCRKIIFVLSGECLHQVRGQTGDVLLGPGDILVFPFAREQRYRSRDPAQTSRLHVVRLAFDPARLPVLPAAAAAPPGDDAADDVLIRHCLSDAFFLPSGQDEAMRETLAQLRDEARRRLPGYRSRVYGLCLGLTILVARKVGASRSATLAAGAGAVGADYHVARAKEFLWRQRGQHDLCLEQVAAHVQLSKEHLARLFRQSTGLTVFGYLRHARLDLAKTYLASTDRNFNEIARLTGFSSLTVFGRVFRREVGVTLSEYRRHVAEQIAA